MNKEVAIVVVSFDKYCDIWDVFALCLNKYWCNRPYPTYLVTNNLKPQYDGISVIATGDETSWSERVNKALESISENYLIVLLEDYLIDVPVDNSLIDKSIDYMKDNNVDYFRIVPIPVIKGKADSFNIIPISKQSLYGVNLQAAIWNKKYLKEIVSKGSFSAWEFEARQKLTSSNRIEGKCVASKVNIINYENGIIQGKWYQKSISVLKQKGINISLGKRSIMTEKDMRREKFRNFLLHSLPPSMISKLKPLAKKLGFRFVTE